MKRSLFAVAVVALTAGTALAQVVPVAAPKAEPKIAATINGEVLTVEELNRHWERLAPETRANYERSGGKAQFLDTWIRKRLVVQEALKQRYDKTPEGAFDVTTARDAALFDSYIRNVVASSVITEKDLRASYEANKEKFKTPEMVHARHIIATPAKGNVANATGNDAGSEAEAEAKIAMIAQQLKLGSASFEKLAADLSEDGSARSGGDLGWFSRGKMVPEFEDAVFQMKVGETSHVIKTQFGYHVIRVDGRKPAGYVPFEEAKAQLREQLLVERSDRVFAALSQLTSELRSMSSISVNLENL